MVKLNAECSSNMGFLWGRVMILKNHLPGKKDKKKKSKKEKSKKDKKVDKKRKSKD